MISPSEVTQSKPRRGKKRLQEPNTPFLLETVPDTNGTVVIVSYFTCSVYAIQLGARRVASASAGNRDGGA